MHIDEKNIMKFSIVATLGLGLFTHFAFAVAEPQKDINTTTTSFSVGVGATRLVFDPTQKSISVAVNNPQTYPILVQSKVLEEDKKTAAPFVITPPLFRLEASQQSRLSVVPTGEVGAEGREKLYWVCITGVPPSGGDQWAKDKDGKSLAPQPKDKVSIQVKVSVGTCIKFFVRPSELKGSTTAAESLVWSHAGKKIAVKNPTPFYINLSKVTVGGERLKNVKYLSPFSSQDFILPEGIGGEVKWTVINDYGGESKEYSVSIS